MKKLTLFVAAALTASTTALAENSYLDRTGWSWSASSTYPYITEDIAGLDGMHDNDVSTCWHTDYSAASGTPERSNPHWLMIDRGPDATPFYGISYLTRQNTINQCCTYYMVYLSDKDLSSTPATTTDDIIATLGEPDYKGGWEASLNELVLNFTSPSTARYVLFVNVSSYNSSSAACAEFNLLAKRGTPTGTTTFNAVKITPADGSAPHRIALDGTNLSIAMSGTAVRLSNSEITVEYLMREYSRMEFENYEFPSGLYDGTKQDAIDFPVSPFALAVTPAEGKVKTLSAATVESADGTPAEVNMACTTPLQVMFGNEVVRELSAVKMADNLVDGKYVIDKIPATADGIYSLLIPAEFFVYANGQRSQELTLDWDVDSNYEQSGLDEIGSDCRTLAISHRGGRLTVDGAEAGSAITLTSTSGIAVATATADGLGRATFNTGALAKGAYILTAGSTTLKIIL